MPAVAELLVEIGTEELPPKTLRDLELAFAEGITAGLRAAGLGGESCESFATPRRLAVLVSKVRNEQPTQVIDKRGPPLKVAFDAAGKPTRAAVAFAEGCGVDVGALQKLETAAGAWLTFRGEARGRSAAELIPGIVAAALEALPVARRMRWGSHEIQFVRPVHWVVLMMGSAVVPAEILGQRAGNVSRGHRFLAAKPIVIANASSYRELLEREGSVVAGFEERRERIRRLAAEVATAVGSSLVLAPGVLDEVTALVEWPVALAGTFDPEFLRLPEEVLAATLQGHQRYFPLRGVDGRFVARFVAISNLRSRDPEQVRRGNERVVRPRLADAGFFWDKDLRSPLASRSEALGNVVFQRGLGSLRDKSTRVARLARRLCPVTGADEKAAVRAAELSKNDLLTEMVKEFPELQGRMGYYYAVHDGEPEAVAKAIEEQYLPRQAGDEIARTPAGQCLALADRLDTLAGVFALGKRPTGNKDPFGLRRAALGLVRTLIEADLDLSLQEFLAEAVALLPCAVADPTNVAQELYDFIIERLRSYYMDGLAPGFAPGEVTAEMFEAVRVRKPASPLDFHQRLAAVKAFMGLDEAQSLAIANKRIANILKGSEEDVGTVVDPGLFEAEAERRLHSAVNAIVPIHQAGLGARRYAEVLRQLATLRDPVDEFFIAVMVMAPELEQRRNRLAQLRRLRNLFLDIADLSCLPAA